MNPMLKRVLGALAVKEVIDRIQEARKPRRGLFGRLGSLLVPAAIAGVAYYLYKNGRLDPLIEQGKELLNRAEEDAYVPAPPPSTSSL
jgi:hypothetical protein